MDKFTKISLLLSLLVLTIIFVPMILIWAVNVLGSAAVAGFAIPTTWDTWFASLVLLFIVGSPSR